MMENKSLVSVIVPIYNVSAYLRACVESIIFQSYKNIEIILVNDGSTDKKSGLICDDYAKLDSRVRVIHKKNGGLSDARNVGLEAAVGKYIAFIDGDDYISPDYIQTLYDSCMQNDADISSCGYYRVYGEKEVQASKNVNKKLFTGIDAIRDIFTAGSLCEVMTWNKLYKRSLFIDNNIRFPLGKIHEDNFTTYKLFYYANKVSFINEPLYYYIQREDSIMGREFNCKRFHLFDMLKEAEDFFVDKSVDMKQELQSARLMWTLGLYSDYLAASIKSKRDGDRLRSEMSLGIYVFANNVITTKHKILYALIRVNPRLYGLMRKKYDQGKI